MSQSLEDNSLWYHYKSKVWPEESGQTYSVHNIVRTLRSIHNQGELAYMSMPITSGKILYDELSQHLYSEELLNLVTSSASSAEKYKEFPKFKDIIKTVMDKNYLLGVAFLEDLEKRINKPILFPADLFPRGEKWSQDNFQALWLTLISEKCSELHLCKDWEYSNGAAEEFTHVYQLRLGIPNGGFGAEDISPFFNTKEGIEKSRARMRNISVYDYQGNTVSLADGIKKIDEVISWLKSGPFNLGKIEKTRELLEWTFDMTEKGFYQ
ncbi:Uncharacterised protein [uncultured archaeon]|nr:Uncharacterised protein [uncultured archaeon]